ncbi:MAG: hypothetical protein QOI10_4205 [Solirubrobacterales bacterium]|jgi:hypothetical protein|nr:hypothetical protein [Solirubrobacterales bacterium]
MPVVDHDRSLSALVAAVDAAAGVTCRIGHFGAEVRAPLVEFDPDVVWLGVESRGECGPGIAS